jgi:hypothetical protein
MPKRENWVPGREVKLLELLEIWLVKLAITALQTAYDWPAAECTQTLAAFTAFIDARTAYRAAPTKVNHTAKEEQKKAAIEALRKFARERVRNNSKMTDPQKQELGVTIADPEPSPPPVPKSGPDSETIINSRNPGVVTIRYLGAKPYGVDRIGIAWMISDTVIESPDQLTNYDTFSHNPWEKTFGFADRGKKLYYSLRYLTRDGASHWSDVRETVIP